MSGNVFPQILVPFPSPDASTLKSNGCSALLDLHGAKAAPWSTGKWMEHHY